MVFECCDHGTEFFLYTVNIDIIFTAKTSIVFDIDNRRKHVRNGFYRVAEILRLILSGCLKAEEVISSDTDRSLRSAFPV